MKRFHAICLFLFICCATAMAQAKPSVSILGDSYSTFEGYLTPDTMDIWYFENKQDPRRTDVKSVGETWWMQLIKKKNWKLELNNSWSGSTICYTGYGDEDYRLRSFITRVPALGSPDIILIFGGTNDSWSNAPVGEYKYADWRRADLYTFRPAMACMLHKIKERYPTADIYFISNDGLKSEITESLAQICKHYDVPMIQLENISKTAGHPNVKGMTQIAEQLDKAIK
jgi:lysophospholipase L1-like esterase